jgi:hypothetical protein
MFLQLCKAPAVNLFKEICGLKGDAVEKFRTFHEQKILFKIIKYRKI